MDMDVLHAVLHLTLITTSPKGSVYLVVWILAIIAVHQIAAKSVSQDITWYLVLAVSALKDARLVVAPVDAQNAKTNTIYLHLAVSPVVLTVLAAMIM